MQKDLKIGMILGIVLVTAAGAWLSSRQELSVEARTEQNNSGLVQTENAVEPSRFVVMNSHNNSSPKKNIVKANHPAVRAITDSAEVTIKANTSKPVTMGFQKIHIVREGETLSGISSRYYGSINKVEDIINANRDVITNPDFIKPGTRLIIPE